MRDPKAIAAARAIHARIIALVERDNPDFFHEFEAAVLSGDPLEVAEAVEKGKAVARDILPEAQAGSDQAIDDKCLVLIAVVAIVAAHVAAAVNHVLVAETTYVTGLATGDSKGDEGIIGAKKETLLAGQVAKDVANMTRVTVWEFNSPTTKNLVDVYTVANTKHGLIIGDFDGDGRKDDRLYYSTGGVRDDLLSTDRGDYIVDMDRWARPHVADFDGNGVDDILFEEPGFDRHYIWFFNRSVGATPGFTFVRYIGSLTTQRAVVGDFDGNGRDDIIWYGPGSVADNVWTFNSNLIFSSAPTALPAGGTYLPVAGDFVGDNADDIIWICNGDCNEPVWQFSQGSFNIWLREMNLFVPGLRGTFVTDFDNNGKDDIFWYTPGPEADYQMLWQNGDTFTAVTHDVRGNFQPAVGKMGSSQFPSVFWWPIRQ